MFHCIKNFEDAFEKQFDTRIPWQRVPDHIPERLLDKFLEERKERELEEFLGIMRSYLLKMNFDVFFQEILDEFFLG